MTMLLRSLALACAALAAPASAGILYWSSWTNPVGIHELHLFDGPTFVTSVVQAPDTLGSPWGYRDGAADRAGYMYFGWENGVRRHALATGALDAGYAINGGAPGGVGTWRALAFDPALDGGAGGFWVANLSSSLVATTLGGTLLSSFANPGWPIWGLAYDDADGNLWAHTTDGAVIKVSTTTGTVLPGAGWPSAFTPPSGQGLGGVHDGTGRIGAIGGMPSQSGFYDTTGNMVLGPWTMPNSGYYGIAVVPEPGMLLLLALGGLMCRRR